LGEGGPRKMLADLDWNPRREPSAAVLEAGCPFDDARDYGRAVHRQNELARGSGLSRRFFHCLELLGSYFASSPELSALLQLQKSLSSLFKLFGALFRRDVRVLRLSPEIGDAKTKLILGVDREDPRAVHRATH